MNAHLPAEPLVRALVPVAGQLHEVLTHMELSVAEGRCPADAPPIPDVLAGLLVDVLEPLARRRHVEVSAATSVLEAIGEAIERDLLLVAPEEG